MSASKLKRKKSAGTKVTVLDSTLRDGAQSENVAFSVESKLLIVQKLDELGVHYIEAGWPSANPRDTLFFEAARKLKLKNAKLTAFGSTRLAANTPAKDPVLNALLAAKTPVITIFGKTWDLHVREALRVPLEKNLDMIHDSVRYLKARCGEVIYDAEHFFNGFLSNPEYALKTLEAAESAGADWLVLCDTNGGVLPHVIRKITSEVFERMNTPIGIHTHNDSETAVASTLAAVAAGARQVHGTINGIGERCGNANLCSVIPNLALKMGYSSIPRRNIKKLREVSRYVSELANLRPWTHQPFVGESAFAHKGGVHINAVMKNPKTYEHIDPAEVGNARRILVSDQAGKSALVMKAKDYGLDITGDDPATKKLLDQLKEMELQGYQFEGAEGSFEMLMKKAKGHWRQFFEILRSRVVVSFDESRREHFSEAVIKLRLPDGKVEHVVAEGNGPVNALDTALRRALVKFYPELADVELHDFRVRILDERVGTKAMTRVLIESADKTDRWGTVGVSENIIEASFHALVDSLDYKLHKKHGK